MSLLKLGNTLIIANPTAHSGRGESAALFVTRFFSSYHAATTSCEVRLTEAQGDARMMASTANSYDTVIALGGDGVVHEVVNGLMRIPVENRPMLGVIPMGTGNDFARTLGMSKNHPERSIAELLKGSERVVDLGRVNNEYFMQTLSFGLDAAIAIDTNDRRMYASSKFSAMLFVTSGLRILTTDLRGWPFHAVIDGEEVNGLDIAFAVQNGPTYGGGFQICPSASPCDGMLDLCATVEKTSLPHSLVLFALIRMGRHTHSRKLSMRKAHHVELEFPHDEHPPCQIDGEQYSADRYVIDVVPHTLRIIAPRSFPW